MMKIMLLCGLIIFMPTQAFAESLVMTLSSNFVRITSNFSGETMSIFGAIRTRLDEDTTAKKYDIIITVSGPERTLEARKKERTLGVWINRKSETFAELPSYFATLSTGNPLSAMPADMRRNFAVTANHIIQRSLERAGHSSATTQAEFAAAIRRLKESDDLYVREDGSVLMIGSQLFKATLDLPANAPVGKYDVMVYLLSERELLSTSSTSFYVIKTGFEQFTAELAQNEPLVFGFLSVLLGIVTGWVGGVVFKRD